MRKIFFPAVKSRMQAGADAVSKYDRPQRPGDNWTEATALCRGTSRSQLRRTFPFSSGAEGAGWNDDVPIAVNMKYLGTRPWPQFSLSHCTQAIRTAPPNVRHASACRQDAELSMCDVTGNIIA